MAVQNRLLVTTLVAPTMQRIISGPHHVLFYWIQIIFIVYKDVNYISSLMMVNNWQMVQHLSYSIFI